MEKGNQKKGVSLIVVNRIMLVLALLLAVFTVIEVAVNAVRYSEMETLSDKYSSYFEAATRVSDASDYLTSEVRKYINLKDRKYLDNYFNEINVTKRRESAIEYLEQELSDNESVAHLKEATKLSNELAKIEIYAMRLLIDGLKLDLDDYPEEIRNVEISNNNDRMQPFEKVAHAWELVTDNAYETYKSQIRDAVAACEQAIYKEASVNQLDLSRRMMNSVRTQEILIIVLLAISAATALLAIFLIIKPLRRSQDAINKGEFLNVSGSREMRFFSMAYNSIYERIVKKSEKLSYEATHDALTGIWNRAAFDKDIEEETWEHAALLIVDVDGFKKINDTYLHSTGDIVLKSIAEILKTTFRSDDRVYRIGGDEFAVVMVGAGSGHEELIKQKYASMDSKMKENADKFYGATLSVGVSYGNFKVHSTDIFRSADTALYQVKKNGRNAIAFSSDNWECDTEPAE